MKRFVELSTMGLVPYKPRILRMILGQQSRFKSSLGLRLGVPQ
jgi:hypothetical protein